MMVITFSPRGIQHTLESVDDVECKCSTLFSHLGSCPSQFSTRFWSSIPSKLPTSTLPSQSGSHLHIAHHQHLVRAKEILAEYFGWRLSPQVPLLDQRPDPVYADYSRAQVNWSQALRLGDELSQVLMRLHRYLAIRYLCAERHSEAYEPAQELQDALQEFHRAHEQLTRYEVGDGAEAILQWHRDANTLAFVSTWPKIIELVQATAQAAVDSAERAWAMAVRDFRQGGFEEEAYESIDLPNFRETEARYVH